MWGEEKERLYGHSWDKQTLYTVYILGEGEEEQLHLAVSICYFKLKYALLLSLWHIICLVSCSALLSLRFIAFEGSQDWRIQFFLHFFSLRSAAGTTATPSRIVKVKISHVKV